MINKCLLKSIACDNRCLIIFDVICKFVYSRDTCKPKLFG